MPRSYTTAQREDLAAFVQWLIDASPYKVDADLARAAGYPPSNLSKVKNGHGSIDGINLLKLIRAAGVLSPEFDIQPQEPPTPPTQLHPEARLVAEVGQMVNEVHADLVARIERSVREVLDALQPAPPQQTAPPQQQGE
jgi:hypothetical protein